MKLRTRREFVKSAAAALLTTLRPRSSFGRPKARVVVIGGGIGGATVAKYLAVNSTIEVTLIEPKRTYATCFFSNLYLAGLRPFASLNHTLDALCQRYGIAVIRESAAAIDAAARTVALKNGSKLAYDRLVVAPGIAFRDGALKGYDEDATKIMPHAWIAGPQTRLLRRQLKSMDDGGVFVIVVPPNPIRCPPAPYERASLVASYFQREKPKSKILILDAKDTFLAQDIFEDGWNRHYPDMIEWLPAQFTGGVTAVDAKSRTLITDGETFKAAVANVIPAQMAGLLAQRAGLADPSGWCPVDPITFASTLQPDIHVVGDAIAGDDMPKSASFANSQAKACALAIAADLTGSARGAPQLANTCYTHIGPDDAFANVISYKPVNGKLERIVGSASKVADSAEVRRETARAAEGWYDAFTHDVFG